MNHVFFELAPPRKSVFRKDSVLRNVDKFFGHESSQAPFSGGVSDASQKNRYIEDSKTGVVRSLKYEGPQKTLCSVRSLKK